jgi:hypothetical protein
VLYAENALAHFAGSHLPLEHYLGFRYAPPQAFTLSPAPQASHASTVSYFSKSEVLKPKIKGETTWH